MNTSASTTHDDFKDLVGHTVPYHFSAGIVVLSYFVSYLGALTTLELLMRRTSMRGLYNWSLLIGASISMGGIAIWSMHFIGNYAIVLGKGEMDLQIVYSSGFTGLSFFLPIAVLFLAFCAVGLDDSVSIPRLVIGGTLAGLGVCGMHYMGQAGIANYTCVYQLGFVFLSAVIACVASIVALGLFFMFRSAWNSSWWKRAIVAAVLATAVSGMHWLASAETAYRLKTSSPSKNNISPTATVIAVIVFSVFGSFALIFLTLFAQRRRARAEKKAKQVVLATAIFDKEGKLLVSPEGLLPTRKITNAYLERTVNDSFGISHPSFHWIYRTTCNWAGVADLIPKMRIHLRRIGLIVNRVGSNVEDKLLKEGSGTPVDDYLLIFRELFCVAAGDLAADLNIPVEKLGMLYEDIVITGLKDKKKSKGKRATTDLSDLERQGPSSELGKGKLLFLVKLVGSREGEQLTSAGFRFAAVEKVIPIIATSLLMGRNDLTSRLQKMNDYATGYQVLDLGVHLALFAIRASMSSGFDILARKDARNLLPTVQLPYDSLEKWQLEYMKQMENFKVTACIKFLHKAAMPSNSNAKEREFAKTLETTLQALMGEIDDFFFNDAVLITEPIEAPCRGHTEDSPPGIAQLITFRIFVPIHARAPGQKLLFTPMNFFKAQQQVYLNSPDHGYFAAKTQREFAPLIDIVEPPKGPSRGSNAEGADEVELEPLSPATVLFAPLKEEAEAKTFVDELFQICIRTKEGARA